MLTDLQTWLDDDVNTWNFNILFCPGISNGLIAENGLDPSKEWEANRHTNFSD